MDTYDFPGGPVTIDTERVWRALREWLEADHTRLCSVRADKLGYVCRLTWDYTDEQLGRVVSGACAARSRLGLADAVANALQQVTE
jgi:hypothetical protein